MTSCCIRNAISTAYALRYQQKCYNTYTTSANLICTAYLYIDYSWNFHNFHKKSWHSMLIRSFPLITVQGHYERRLITHIIYSSWSFKSIFAYLFLIYCISDKLFSRNLVFYHYSFSFRSCWLWIHSRNLCFLTLGYHLILIRLLQIIALYTLDCSDTSSYSNRSYI